MSAPRKYFIGGNWKCNGTIKLINEWLTFLNKINFDPSEIDVIVSPTFLHLYYVINNIKKDFQISAQNISSTGMGAFTGEIAAEQLKDLNINWVIIGHSERRQLYNETNEILLNKLKIALNQNLKIIFCIGETLAEREGSQTLHIINHQLDIIIFNIKEYFENKNKYEDIVIAYEPIWAIGTGKVATPNQAQDVHAHIRNYILKNINKKASESIRIIYGGSVKANNASELIALKDVDGFLVGGASLKPEFTDIIMTALN